MSDDGVVGVFRKRLYPTEFNEYIKPIVFSKGLGQEFLVLPFKVPTRRSLLSYVIRIYFCVSLWRYDILFCGPASREPIALNAYRELEAHVLYSVDSSSPAPWQRLKTQHEKGWDRFCLNQVWTCYFFLLLKKYIWISKITWPTLRVVYNVCRTSSTMYYVGASAGIEIPLLLLLLYIYKWH